MSGHHHRHTARRSSDPCLYLSSRGPNVDDRFVHRKCKRCGEAKAELEGLRAENKDLQLTSDEDKVRLASLGQEMKELKVTSGQAQTDLYTAQTQLGVAQAQLDTAQADLGAAQAELGAARKRMVKLRETFSLQPRPLEPRPN